MDENRRLLRRLGIVVARGRARTYRLVSGSEEIATHLDEKRVASSEKTGTALHSPVERDREEHQGARLMQRAGSRAGRRNIAMANAMRNIRAEFLVAKGSSTCFAGGLCAGKERYLLSQDHDQRRTCLGSETSP